MLFIHFLDRFGQFPQTVIKLRCLCMRFVLDVLVNTVKNVGNNDITETVIILQQGRVDGIKKMEMWFVFILIIRFLP
ncbi:hypothetical protein ATO50_08335 [Aeromonas hydrophila]|nr:hypothetical protein ATO50_08335 [Aeromonas hydrophila]